ncbi:Restriction endonuclease [uncultured virus]|nr:Restriction endonuclease [uncultured virus]
MHRNIILHALSKPNINVFDEVISAIEYEFNKPARDIKEMKDRANKKKKGDIWEQFCKDWLLGTGNYSQVWLLDEYNQEFHHIVPKIVPDKTITTIKDIKHQEYISKQSGPMNRTFISKQDNGIDIIAQTTTGQWFAIQCKYRNKGKVSWGTLSTFLALCHRTGPWDKYIVMTNSTGITHKLPKTPKDKSICQTTFKNTTREHWLKMIGKDTGQRLVQDPIIPIIKPLQLLVLNPGITPVQPIIQPIIQPTIQPTIQPIIPPIMQPIIRPVIQPIISPIISLPIQPLIQTAKPDLDELRRRRLARFDNINKTQDK